MITPAFNLTATERVLPRLAIDFTTAVLDSRVVISRANNTATRISSNGTIEIVNANLPRFDYNPTTLLCNGLLIEGARTNLLLNALIDGTSLSTQTVTVTAAAHTLSFYGSGSIVLSGTYSATVSGSGAYPTRKTLTFTPTAGSLTLTVSGSVQFAQLEVGGFASSFIPTAGSAVQRNNDIATMSGTSFSSWYNQSNGSFYAKILKQNRVAAGAVFGALQSGSAYMDLQINPSSDNFIMTNGTYTANAAFADTSTGVIGLAASYTDRRAGLSVSGGAVAAQSTASASVPSPASLRIGNGIGAGLLYGHMQKLMYWPQTLTDAEIRAFSK